MSMTSLLQTVMENFRQNRWMKLHSIKVDVVIKSTLISWQHFTYKMEKLLDKSVKYKNQEYLHTQYSK